MIVLRRPYDAEQKEFSRLTEAIKGARNIKATKRLWSIKLNKRIKDNIEKLDKQMELIDSRHYNPVINPTLDNRLVEIAEKRGKLVHPARIDNSLANNVVKEIEPQDFKQGELIVHNSPEVVADLKRQLGKRTEYISHPDNSGSERLAHELGHIENARPILHPISWINSRLANRKVVRFGIEETATAQRFGQPDEKSRGWWRTLGRYLAAKSVNHEESTANKNAIKFLKKAGATPKEIEQSQANLANNIATYEPSGEVYWLTSLRNTIRPK